MFEKAIIVFFSFCHDREPFSSLFISMSTFFPFKGLILMIDCRITGRKTNIVNPLTKACDIMASEQKSLRRRKCCLSFCPILYQRLGFITRI